MLAGVNTTRISPAVRPRLRLPVAGRPGRPAPRLAAALGRPHRDGDQGRGRRLAENYVFAVVDGRLRKIAEFHGQLAGICMRYWQADALYGETSEEAFRVDTGDGVNTPETIADGQLRAVLLLKVAPFAEFVEVQIVKQAITEALA